MYVAIRTGSATAWADAHITAFAVGDTLMPQTAERTIVGFGETAIEAVLNAHQQPPTVCTTNVDA